MANVITNLGKALVASRLMGTGAEPKYLAFGTGAGTAGAADTGLFSEVADGRVTGTSSLGTTAVANDTYIVTGTYTAPGARALTNAGLFTDVSAGELFMKGDFAVINLAQDDSLTLTMKVQFV